MSRLRAPRVLMVAVLAATAVLSAVPAPDNRSSLPHCPPVARIHEIDAAQGVTDPSVLMIPVGPSIARMENLPPPAAYPTVLLSRKAHREQVRP